MSKPRVGFVGFGRMGANIAQRLTNLGYEVSYIAELTYPGRAGAADLKK